MASGSSAGVDAGPVAGTPVVDSACTPAVTTHAMLPSDLQKLLHVAAVAKSLGLFSGERSGHVNIDVQTASKGVVSPLCGMEAPAFDETFDSATEPAEAGRARQHRFSARSGRSPAAPIQRWWPVRLM